MSHANQRPTGLTIATPANWVSVDFGRLTSDGSATRDVVSRLPTGQEGTPSPREVVDAMLSGAQAVRDAGVCCAAALVDLAGPEPVMAGMTLAVMAGPAAEGPVDANSIARSIENGRLRDRRTVSVVALPAGEAARG